MNNKQIGNDAPIGIFDSGLGGLSIWKEIHELLPNESTVYLADSANAPYGEKTKGEIIELSIKNTELLIARGCKLIVVACNTATTNAIKTLRANYPIPFIGIEPAIKPAALQSKTHKIGVLATKGTLTSELFSATSNQFKPGKDFIEVEGKGLVRLIEEGKINDTKDLLIKYLTPMIEQGVDNIVLGCSHYPFLIPIIQEIIPKGIHIIDSGRAVALQTKNILTQKNKLSQLSNPDVKFYTNNDVGVLNDFLLMIGVKNPKVKCLKF